MDAQTSRKELNGDSPVEDHFHSEDYFHSDDYFQPDNDSAGELAVKNLVKETAAKNLVKETAVKNLVEEIVESGFTLSNLERFREITGRLPSLEEVLSPAHLLTNYGKSFGEGDDLRRCYTLVGKNVESGKYCQATPVGIYFVVAQNRESLSEAVGESIEAIAAEKRTEKGAEKGTRRQGCKPGEYAPGIEITAIRPRQYQRLEMVKRGELPEERNGEKLYTCSIDVSRLNPEQAEYAFTVLYDLLKEKEVEVHNNEERIHKKASFKDALTAVSEGSIAKIDTARVNVYLKSNLGYRLKVDIFGSKGEIKEFAGRLERVLKDTFKKHF